MMAITFLMSALSAIVTLADCSCDSTPLFVSPSLESKAVSSTKAEHCTIDIKPRTGYSSSSYYLEITWVSWDFEIPGNMPACKENHLEVLVTSYYRSVGKFCSTNVGYPYKMYSKDGYAKISYLNSGYSSAVRFSFYYQLLSRTSQALGGPLSNNWCDTNRIYKGSGAVYSSGWPSGYQQFSSSCEFKIERSYGYQGIYVFFMDINMYPYGARPDCIQLFGSNDSNSYSAISSKLCGTHYQKAYATYSRYLKITFDRWNGASVSYSGFLAGYIMFKTAAPLTTLKPDSVTTSYWKNPDVVTTSSSTNLLAIVLFVTIPLLIIIIIVVVIAVVVCKIRHRRQATDRMELDHNAPPVIPSAPPQPTAPETFHNAPSMPTASYPYDQPQHMHLSANMPAGGHPTESYPIGYLPTTYYPTHQNSTPDNAFQQFSSTVTPVDHSIPAGALHQPPSLRVQEQQLSTLSPSSGIGSNPRVPPVGALPNVASPTCNSVVHS